LTNEKRWCIVHTIPAKTNEKFFATSIYSIKRQINFNAETHTKENVMTSTIRQYTNWLFMQPLHQGQSSLRPCSIDMELRGYEPSKPFVADSKEKTY